MNIAVVGLGNVGRNVLRIIEASRPRLERIAGEPVRIVSVSDSKHIVADNAGLSIPPILEAKESGDLMKAGYRETDVVGMYDAGTDLVVDVSSATRDGIRGRDLYLMAFRMGCNVVTANKAPLALHWKDIMLEKELRGHLIRYESAVAGGVPLFNLRDYSLMSSEVVSFRGIVSSSVNMVLSDMLEGKDFKAAVDRAIKAGVAETDYHDDTMGLDAARKTVILANSLFGANLTLSDISYEGVENSLEKIESLRKEGGKYRVVSKISREDGVEVSSSISLIGQDDPLNVLKDLSLGYTIKTDNNGEVLVAGLEDTPLETASGVVNDIMLLSRC